MHIEAGDIGADQGPGDGDAGAAKELMHTSGDDRQLQRIGTAEAVDDGDDRLSGFQS